jgi:hypothetical protein
VRRLKIRVSGVQGVATCPNGQPEAIEGKAHAVRAATLLYFRRASSMLCDSVMTDITNQRRS